MALHTTNHHLPLKSQIDDLTLCERFDKGIVLSLIKNNLMTRDGYSPYCGAEHCFGHWPRSIFNGEQFACPHCDWVSRFPESFIQEYKTKWNLSNPTHNKTESNYHTGK